MDFKTELEEEQVKFGRVEECRVQHVRSLSSFVKDDLLIFHFIFIDE